MDKTYRPEWRIDILYFRIRVNDFCEQTWNICDISYFGHIHIPCPTNIIRIICLRSNPTSSFLCFTNFANSSLRHTRTVNFSSYALRIYIFIYTYIFRYIYKYINAVQYLFSSINILNKKYYCYKVLCQHIDASVTQIR